MTSVTASTTETTHPVDQVLPFPQMFVYDFVPQSDHAGGHAAGTGHAQGQPPTGLSAEGEE